MMPSKRENPPPAQTSRQDRSAIPANSGDATNAASGLTDRGWIIAAVPSMAAMLKMFEP